MTVSVDVVCRGLRAPSELTEAARGAQPAKTHNILEMLWRWLIGETDNSEDFKAALPHIFFQLEQCRQLREGLTGKLTISVWLSNKKCLMMQQSADGQQVTAAICTVGGYFIPRWSRSPLEEVNRGPGSGSTFQQLHVKLAKEYSRQFGNSGSETTDNVVFNGFESAGGNSTHPITINGSDLLSAARHVVVESGDAISPQEIRSPSSSLSSNGSMDEERAIQASLQDVLISQQNERDIIQRRMLQLTTNFVENTPSVATSESVRQAIQHRLGELNTLAGWQNSTGKRFVMDDGTDLFSATKFATTDKETEWCLLRTSTSTNTYGFITADSAKMLINKPNAKNPFIPAEPIAADTFIRGEQLLQWLDVPV